MCECGDEDGLRMTDNGWKCADVHICGCGDDDRLECADVHICECGDDNG